MDDPFGLNRTPSKQSLSSPYLNFDPSILNSGGSQFVIPEGQGEHRGKMEMAFLKIGGAVGFGGLFGGVSGLYQGLNETSTLMGNVRRTQLLNFTLKRGAASAQAFGTLALMFSLYDTFISLGRGVDDELNMFAAATVTGMTYTATQGLKKTARGGLIGLGLSLSYYAYVNRTALLAKTHSLTQ